MLAFAQSKSFDWRLSIMMGFTIFGVMVWFSCELLSAFSLLTFGGLVVFWTLCILALVIIIRINTRNTPVSILSALFKPHQKYIHISTVSQILPLIFITISCITLLLIALQSAPNTWDSMTYHLSRVVHWQQQQSIRFFPTNNLRQLHSGPWAEMAILHVSILAGSDRLSNLIQWIAMIGSLIAVSYIVKILGGNKSSQVMAALMVATIPMGILQSTSTQNDYVVALWLCTLTIFSLKIIGRDYQEANLNSLCVFAGLSLGLAILTKPTSLIFALPLIIWLSLVLLRRHGMHILKPTLVIGMMALLINCGQFTRNYLLFRNPLGPISEYGDVTAYKYTNDVFNMSVLTSNLLRNSAIHLSTPFAKFNDIVLKSNQQVHTWLGMDINDPRTTWTGTNFSVGFSRHEDLAGNPIHFLLIGFSLLLLMQIKKPKVILLGVCVVTGFVLFSFLLKWQPWNSRLQLPLFILGSTFSAVVLTKSLTRGLFALIAIILIAASISYIINNPSRPIIGPDSVFDKDRVSQYFTNRQDIMQPYKMAADLIRMRNCKKIGLIIGSDDWEYPLWVLTGASNGESRIESINVGNSSSLFSNSFTPCAIITTVSKPEQMMMFEETTYSMMLEATPVAVFLSQNLSVP
jgi:hypothetical protein